MKALFRQLASALPGQDGGADASQGASAAENIVITPTPAQPAKKAAAGGCAC